MRSIRRMIAAGVVSLLVIISSTGYLRAQSEQDGSSPAVPRGRSALRNGELATAKALLEQAVQQDPNSAEARFLLGITYLRLGQTAAAEAQLSRTVLLRPDYAE